MDQGNVAAALTVVRTIRPEWDIRATRAQIEVLADGKYTHADVVWVCVTVAENRNNRAPSQLTSIGPQLIEKLHEKTGINRTWTGSPGRRDDAFLCDTCNKTEAVCMSAATNLDGSDHLFKSIRQAEAERAQRHGGREAAKAFAQARAARLNRAADVGVGHLPADTMQPTEPEQESA